MADNHVVKVPVVLGVVAASAIAERVWPLRPRREAQGPHVARDLAVGALSALAMNALHSLARGGQAPRLSGRARAPVLHIVGQILLLDYTLFLWHAANHHVPLLWRFHRFHHEDVDLDAATGARFHPGEMSLSVLFRWLQVRVIDPDPLAMSIWQTMLLSSIFFHHSNTRLPRRADDRMARAFVTPRMHGIHHSIVPEETNSNFASLFTWWDMLHGTYRMDVPQESITIGAPAPSRARR